MTREEFKIMAHGQFAIMNTEGTINKTEMKNFVEGALFAFDICHKKRKTEQTDKKDESCSSSTNII